MLNSGDFRKLQVTSAATLRKWLLKHYDQVESVWLVTFKKRVEKKYVLTCEVLDQLMCFKCIRRIANTSTTSTIPRKKP